MSNEQRIERLEAVHQIAKGIVHDPAMDDQVRQTARDSCVSTHTEVQRLRTEGG
jgi:hypothetical protein